MKLINKNQWMSNCDDQINHSIKDGVVRINAIQALDSC